MYKRMKTLLMFISVFLIPLPVLVSASEPGIKTEQLLQTEQSWDGTNYTHYPVGIPEVTVLKMTLSPYSKLTWHEHLVPNVAYVLEGELFVEKKSDGRKKTLEAGDVLPELVGMGHRGYTTEKGATLLIFYAGRKGIPLSRPVQ